MVLQVSEMHYIKSLSPCYYFEILKSILNAQLEVNKKVWLVPASGAVVLFVPCIVADFE